MLAVGSKPGGPFKRVDKGTYTLSDAPSKAGSFAPQPARNRETATRAA